MMYKLKTERWESQAALAGHLSSHGGSDLVVNRAAEAPRLFYSFTVETAAGKREVGVYSSGLGTEIAVLALRSGRALVGVDRALYSVGGEPLRVTFVAELEGVFFEYIDAGAEGVVAIHELGAVHVTPDAEKQWSVVTSDIVESFSIEGSMLILECTDGQRIGVVVCGGKVIKLDAA